MAAERAGIQFLLADIESAHAFLDVAQATPDPTAVARNLTHARRTLASVRYWITQLDDDSELLAEVRAAHDKLQSRIDAFAGRS